MRVDYLIPSDVMVCPNLFVSVQQQLLKDIHYGEINLPAVQQMAQPRMTKQLIDLVLKLFLQFTERRVIQLQKVRESLLCGPLLDNLREQMGMVQGFAQD